ncbi:MAG: hypothetical protein KJ655_04205 [Candidatus Thermoplasmatota archaeon]|nr:hypothetical protein [Candidatus Thermoplasmatota archaeon]
MTIGNIWLIITLGNILLLLALLCIYAHSYIKIKSKFTMGLMIFALVLLFQAVASCPLLHTTCGYCECGIGIFNVLPDFFELVALTILLWISWK